MFTHKSVTITAPADVPIVTVLEAKQQLHLDTTEDDKLIEHYIKTATAFCEHYTQRAFVKQQYTAYLATIGPCIVLPHPPALPEPAPIVEYYDSDTETWEEVDSSEYVYDWQSQPATICQATCSPHYSPTWCHSHIIPDCGSGGGTNSGSRYRVTWWAGYGVEASSVPLLVKQAILLLTAHYYERRLASDNYSTEEIPFGVTVLLDSIRWRFYA